MTAATLIPSYIAGTWDIDPVHSDVSFSVRHMMVSKVRGRFGSFSGQIATGEEITGSSVTATIDATSIDTNNEQRDNHIRSADFFDAASHPTITFQSTGLRFEDGEFLLDGDLTIRGNAKPITLTLDSPAFGPNAQGGMKAGFSATAEINRHDFGVSYNGPIPGGGSVLGDKVQLTLDIEADLQEPKSE